MSERSEGAEALAAVLRLCRVVRRHVQLPGGEQERTVSGAWAEGDERGSFEVRIAEILSPPDPQPAPITRFLAADEMRVVAAHLKAVEKLLEGERPELSLVSELFRRDLLPSRVYAWHWPPPAQREDWGDGIDIVRPAPPGHLSYAVHYSIDEPLIERIEEAAEAAAVLMTGSVRPQARHSPDFRSVIWYGKAYTFTPKQAECVRVLWAAWENGTPEVGEKTVLADAKSILDIDSERLVDLFKGHPAFRVKPGPGMIRSGSTKGAYRLCPPA